MEESERKSYLACTPELKNYEIVRATQSDIYDLDDCIEIFSSVVQELRASSLKKAEISTVIINQFMAKYVYMEDSIFEGLEKLPRQANTKETQDRLLEATKKFNSLSFEFQEEWSQEYWEIYENVRDPVKAVSEVQAVSQQKINKKLLDLQEIAITLTRMSRGVDETENHDDKDPFVMVEEEAQRYANPTITRRNKLRDCNRCTIS